jgi:hypothetical protein
MCTCMVPKGGEQLHFLLIHVSYQITISTHYFRARMLKAARGRWPHGNGIMAEIINNQHSHMANTGHNSQPALPTFWRQVVPCHPQLTQH